MIFRIRRKNTILLTLLEDIYFKYISVDTKSIKAVKEGDYHKIYQARKKLEKEGFSWSGS
ncbi:MAG: hypothetical protein Q7J40_00150 [Atribacterota bacterium]|nr:hypothetical protein [Atribacterota bacterium]